MQIVLYYSNYTEWNSFQKSNLTWFTMLLSTVRLYFFPLLNTSPSLPCSCLSLGFGALCCMRESSLCLALYFKALCLRRLMRKHRDRLVHPSQSEKLIFYFLFRFLKKKYSERYFLCLRISIEHWVFSLSLTILLLVNISWSFSQTQRMHCDGD